MLRIGDAVHVCQCDGAVQSVIALTAGFQAFKPRTEAHTQWRTRLSVFSKIKRGQNKICKKKKKTERNLNLLNTKKPKIRNWSCKKNRGGMATVADY